MEAHRTVASDLSPELFSQKPRRGFSFTCACHRSSILREAGDLGNRGAKPVAGQFDVLQVSACRTLTTDLSGFGFGVVFLQQTRGVVSDTRRLNYFRSLGPGSPTDGGINSSLRER